MGTTKRPVYRLVVADSRSPRDGRFIESIGFYDPLPNPAVVSIDADRVQLWLRRGARPSDSARQLLVKEGLLAARPFKITPRPEAPEPAPAAVAAKVDTDTADEAATADVAIDTPTTDEPANEEPTAESVPDTSDEAGGAAGGSPGAPKARRGGAPAATGPAAATPDEAGGAAGGSPGAPKARRGGAPAATGPAAASEDAPE